jgi:hypothetical protein
MRVRIVGEDDDGKGESVGERTGQVIQPTSKSPQLSSCGIKIKTGEGAFRKDICPTHGQIHCLQQLGRWAQPKDICKTLRLPGGDRHAGLSTKIS